MGRCGNVGACRVVRGMTLNPGHLSVTCIQPAWSTMAFPQLGHCFGPHSQFSLRNYTGKGLGPSRSACLRWSRSIPAFRLQSCLQTIHVQGQGEGSPDTALLLGQVWGQPGGTGAVMLPAACRWGCRGGVVLSQQGVAGFRLDL